MNPRTQDILQELHRGFQNLYGTRLRGLAVYGSYARGEEVAGSDLDVALILDDFVSAGGEVSAFSGLVARLCLSYNCVVSVVPIRERDWRERQTPLLMNIRREGVVVA